MDGTMTWKEVDSLLRDGGRLHTSHVGEYLITADGECRNVRNDVFCAITRRDLVVVCGYDGNAHYTLRHKYA